MSDLTGESGFGKRLRWIDEVLADEEVLRRVRDVDCRLTGQLFYVRHRVVGNPDLPIRTRLAAFAQLQRAIESVLASMSRESNDGCDLANPIPVATDFGLTKWLSDELEGNASADRGFT